MHRLSTGLSLLVIAGMIASPAFAALPIGTPFKGRAPLDCILQANLNDPYCLQLIQKGPQHKSHGQNGQNGGQNGGDQNQPQGNVGQPQVGFGFSQNDRDQCHQSFGSDFGTFATPGFTIPLGIGVPRATATFARSLATSTACIPSFADTCISSRREATSQVKGDRAASYGDAGIVDENISSARLMAELREILLKLILVRNIGETGQTAKTITTPLERCFQKGGWANYGSKAISDLNASIGARTVATRARCKG